MATIIAHRGSCRLFPENSLAAFRHALTHGADVLEVDLRCSADGLLYCYHDRQLHRLTGEQGVFEETCSDTLNRLSFAVGEPLLCFDRFLHEFAGKIGIILDIKTEGVEDKILAATERTGAGESIICSSFSAEVLARLRLLKPSTRIALIAGPLRNVRGRGDQYSSMPHRASVLGCEAVHLNKRIAGVGTINRILNEGMSVSVWTVDDYRQARKLVSRGAGGIFTNVPEELSVSFASLTEDSANPRLGKVASESKSGRGR
jgi:glycerophosphoryl diester phosphodiesterase